MFSLFIFRLKFCKNCRRSDASTTADVIITPTNQRYLAQKMKPTIAAHPKPTQAQRAERVHTGRYDRHSHNDKIRVTTRQSLKYRIFTSNITPSGNFRLFNRDINAARNILYLGLCRFGKDINSRLAAKKNIAFFRAHGP